MAPRTAGRRFPKSGNHHPDNPSTTAHAPGANGTVSDRSEYGEAEDEGTP